MTREHPTSVLRSLVLAALAALSSCTPAPKPSLAPGAPTPRIPAGLVVFARGMSPTDPATTELSTVAPNGASPQRNINVAGLSASQPAWTPDATRLAFSVPTGGGFSAIFEISATDSGGLRKLTNGPGANGFPSYSPDGKKIAYSSSSSGATQIWVMNSDGSNPKPLTTGTFINQDPAWSPDGRKIAFVSGRDQNFEIYVMNADGTNQVRLTRNTVGHPDTTPAWSPDGNKIAWTSSLEGNSDIWVMNADGSDKTQLTTNPGLDGGPSWSPGGTKIAFTSDQSGDSEIWMMDADGSNQIRLTYDPGVPDIEPAWSPES